MAESRPDARRLVRPGAAAGKDAAGVSAVIGALSARVFARIRVVPRKVCLSSLCGAKGFFLVLNA